MAIKRQNREKNRGFGVFWVFFGGGLTRGTVLLYCINKFVIMYAILPYGRKWRKWRKSGGSWELGAGSVPEVRNCVVLCISMIYLS